MPPKIEVRHAKPVPNMESNDNVSKNEAFFELTQIII